jgi:hypothetical protein
MSFVNLNLEKIVDENGKPIVYNDEIRVFYTNESERLI